MGTRRRKDRFRCEDRVFSCGEDAWCDFGAIRKSYALAGWRELPWNRRTWRGLGVGQLLGTTFCVVRSDDGHFSVVQLPAAESEIIATIEPPAEHLSLDVERGFGEEFGG